MAIGKNHIGTMAGKLNGEMMPTTPSGCRDGVHVDLGRGVLGEAALDQVRDAAGELDDLLAAADLAERVGEHLAVLGGDDRCQLFLARVQQLAESEEDLRALGQRGVPPPRKSGQRRGDDLIDVVLRSERELRGDLAGGRVGHVGEAPAVALEDLAGLPVVDVSLPWFVPI